jgi:hypothetical protein
MLDAWDEVDACSLFVILAACLLGVDLKPSERLAELLAHTA